MNFVETFKQVLKEKDREILMPGDLIEKWDEFVEQCEEGYQLSLYDYDNEITIRDDIHDIISSKILQEFKEYKIFIEQVDFIDRRFKEVSIECDNIPGQTWWKRRILKYAGDQYVENVKAEWNMDVVRL